MREALRRQAQYMRSIRDSWRSAKKALVGKASALKAGRSPISRTCQIPQLREKYTALGLCSNAGTFVEVGGYDGESFSNTSFLADQGWRGIYVEPIPAFCTQIRLRHALNKVTVENLAIGEGEGVAQINIMGTLSTLSGPTRTAFEGIPWATGCVANAKIVQVKTASIGAVLAHNFVPSDLELMVIDVEGSEEPITQSLLATHWRPRVLIVELIDQHPDFAPYPDLQRSALRTREAILANGYTQFYADSINSIFEYNTRN
jgi:FkbM family methyltransferase